jgi:hypothetical protein
VHPDQFITAIAALMEGNLEQHMPSLCLYGFSGRFL